MYVSLLNGYVQKTQEVTNKKKPIIPSLALHK